MPDHISEIILPATRVILDLYDLTDLLPITIFELYFRDGVA